MALRRIVYTSKASVQFSKRSLLDLLHESRAFNSIDDISGVLMHSKGYFLQIIEGESEALDDLFARLLRDTRHNEVKIIRDSSADERLFSNWSMGCADFDEPELSMIPGILTDFSDPQVIEDLIIRLPEVATFLLETID